MEYYYTPIRMAKIKSCNTKHWQGCRKPDKSFIAVKDVKCTANLENISAVSYKTKHVITT